MPNVAALATNQMQNLMTPPNPGASEHFAADPTLRFLLQTVTFLRLTLFDADHSSSQLTRQLKLQAALRKMSTI